MSNYPAYICAMKPGNIHYDRYKQYLYFGAIIDRKTVYGRMTRLKEMTRVGWTIKQINTTQNTKQVKRNIKVPDKCKKGYYFPSLWEQYNISHHETVSWSIACRRYNSGWDSFRSCIQPKHANNLTILKKVKNT